MTKPELGTKRLCASCGARFYDLNKTPITCPKCGTPFEVVATTTRPRVDQRMRKPEPETEEVREAEMISLEEADAEVQGKKVQVPADDAEAIEDVETDETVEDEETLIEEVDEEDTDISEIIDGDIKDEEET